ncbi:MAG TPA: metallophosphoesterase [Anaerolineales bacterium]|nr:metallophosphoesterase [Anaerolineales bacterium]
MMRILAVSDEAVERLYSSRVTENFPGIEAIIGCGDLPKYYLDFLGSVYNLSVLFVPGNHDDYTAGAVAEPEQVGDNIDGQVIEYKGLTFAGLGGSILYNRCSANQYTQKEMDYKTRKLMLKVLVHRFKTGRQIDVFVTHSPPFGIHDDPNDPAHIGFKAFNGFIRLVKPRFMLHGHTIFYDQNIKNFTTLKFSTRIVNIYPYRVLEI